MRDLGFVIKIEMPLPEGCLDFRWCLGESLEEFEEWKRGWPRRMNRPGTAMAFYRQLLEEQKKEPATEGIVRRRVRAGRAGDVGLSKFWTKKPS
ncbi:hypothetical protein CC80DRAFT_492631 [Byssothecium circinans]|uniref:Uncharacterized protein n=1 Tax=Byssothecium circinans TaxID=147558 RepID=A0A6A5U5K8_9PLEO|nr:hypothetical protein CC80DRAFT_492631 [Byssothecium circinans]